MNIEEMKSRREELLAKVSKGMEARRNLNTQLKELQKELSTLSESLEISERLGRPVTVVDAEGVESAEAFGTPGT